MCSDEIRWDRWDGGLEYVQAHTPCAPLFRSNALIAPRRPVLVVLLTGLSVRVVVIWQCSVPGHSWCFQLGVTVVGEFSCPPGSCSSLWAFSSSILFCSSASFVPSLGVNWGWIFGDVVHWTFPATARLAMFRGRTLWDPWGLFFIPWFSHLCDIFCTLVVGKSFLVIHLC